MNDYIKEMREIIGHKPLLTIGCGVIIENENGEILLQRRTDDGTWGTPGGGMNYGETYTETAIREVFEETGLTVSELKLFGIYSGKNKIIEYPNKDVCFGGVVVFITDKYNGDLINCPIECKEHRFFHRNNLPADLNKLNKQWIVQWRDGQDAIYFD